MIKGLLKVNVIIACKGISVSVGGDPGLENVIRHFEGMKTLRKVR